MAEAAIANLNNNRNCSTVRVYRYMHVNYDSKLPSETILGQERERLAPLLPKDAKNSPSPQTQRMLCISPLLDYHYQTTTKHLIARCKQPVSCCSRCLDTSSSRHTICRLTIAFTGRATYNELDSFNVRVACSRMQSSC